MPTGKSTACAAALLLACASALSASHTTFVKQSERVRVSPSMAGAEPVTGNVADLASDTLVILPAKKSNLGKGAWIGAAAGTALPLYSSLSTALPLFAQEEAPARVSNQERIPPAWFVRIEGGAAKIHDRDPSSAWLGARVGRKIPRNGILRWDVGIGGSGADEGFLTVTGGIEVQPVPRFYVTPIIRGEFGLLAEPEFSGAVYAGQFGLAINPARSVSIRGVYQIAGHGGEPGPEGFLGAIEFRWGR